jgi:predicted transglutaminase-like cysteine proteinase
MSDRLELFAGVNLAVNQSIRWVSDQDLYGIPEYWTIPKAGLGDCDDYTLVKRARLLAAGVPLEDLRIAFCEVPGLGYHAVLVATDPDTGDWVLDNRHQGLLRWSDTGYRLMAIQAGQGWQTASIQRGVA